MRWNPRRALAALVVAAGGLAAFSGARAAVTPRARPPAPEKQAVDQRMGTTQEWTAALLLATRNLSPIACELVSRGAFQSWNNGQSVRPVLAGAGVDAAAAAIADWSAGRIQDPAVVEPLAAALHDGDPCVRGFGARLLGRTRQTQAVQRLAEALRDDNARTRAAAALGLGEAAAPSMVPELVRALRDLEPAVRSTAAWALGRLDDRGALRELVAAMEDEAPEVRLNAAWALGQIEDRAALPALARSLRNDADPRIRKAAAWAMGRILG